MFNNMDRNIFTKFNLYDQIGYLMVGSISVLIIVINTEFFYDFRLPDLSINNFIIWFVVVYFLGHLIQALSNLINKIPLIKLLIKEDKGKFNDDQKEILEGAKKFFKLRSQNESVLWNLCYLYSLSKDTTGQIQAFNAYYSMYRGWLVVFLLESVFLFIQLINTRTLFNLSLLIVCFIITAIFYTRSRRFWDYLTSKVLQTYIITRT